MHLVTIRGPGGSGKTTIATALSQELRSHGPCALLSSDDFYWGISGEEHDDELVYEALVRLCDLYLQKGYTAILEGQLTSEEDGTARLSRILEHARSLGAAITSFFLHASIDVVRERIKEKCVREGWRFSEEELASWYSRAQHSQLDNEVVLDGTLPTTDVVREMLHRMHGS